MTDENQGRGGSVGAAPNRSITGVLLVALASPLAIWFAQRGGATRDIPAAPAPATSTAAPSSTPPDYCLGRFASPFREFGVSLPSMPKHPSSDDLYFDAETTPGENGVISSRGSIIKGTAGARDFSASLDGIRSQLDAAKVKSVEVVVATLPDPLDSGLTYQFDALVQAVRLGVERPSNSKQAYYRGRSWLPWDDQEARPAKRVDS